MSKLKPTIASGRCFAMKQYNKALRYIVEKYINNQKNKLDVLDYGSKDSPYKTLFSKMNYISADFSKEADLLLNDDGLLPLEDQSIDVVFSTQVLEHVENVDLYLAEARRVLKKDGMLILATHGYWMYHADPNDFWRWTRDGLIKIITDNKFEIVESLGTIGLTASGLQLVQDGFYLRLHKYKIIKNIFFFSIYLLQCIVDNKSIKKKDVAYHFIIGKRR